MQTIAWFVVLSPGNCYVKQIGEGTWGICVEICGKEYLVDFKDEKLFPTRFVAEELADKALADLDSVFAYLRMNDSSGRREQEREWDVRTFPVLPWEKIPRGAVLREYKFSNGAWGVITVIEEGEFLVVFNESSEDAGFHTFYKDRESIRKAIDFLNVILESGPIERSGPEVYYGDGTFYSLLELPGMHDSPVSSTPPAVEQRLKAVASDRTRPLSWSSAFGPLEPQAPVLPQIPSDEVRADLEEIEYIEMGWLGRLRSGMRRSCICSSCRGEYQLRLYKVSDRYERAYGFVPSMIANAISDVERVWKRVENRKV